MKSLPRLYAIADASFGNPIKLAEDLFAGGARLVQVRNKSANARELLEQVEKIIAIAPPDSFVIVNDRADVARLAGAAGVHLGQTDLPAAAARKILGSAPIVGVSTHNMEQALKADELPVDYIAVGPVYPTSSKNNPDPVIGLAGLAEICRAVTKPVVAIGGIQREGAADVFKAGAASVAVIRDLIGTSDVAVRTREWISSC